MNNIGTVYLIPSVIDDEAMFTIPAFTLEAVKKCHFFFVENERTARRFLKKLWKEMVIDDYVWHTIHKAEENVVNTFKQILLQGKTIGILSEAGCPGVADPGQYLVSAAHTIGATVQPLTGPSSLLLALMASGLNGQQFCFHGYLPIDDFARKEAIKNIEKQSQQKNETEIFIETPYRNKSLFESLIKNCLPATKICIAYALTSADELIKTKPVAQWSKDGFNFEKKPCIFLMQA